MRTLDFVNIAPLLGKAPIRSSGGGARRACLLGPALYDGACGCAFPGHDCNICWVTRRPWYGRDWLLDALEGLFGYCFHVATHPGLSLPLTPSILPLADPLRLVHPKF